MPETPVSRDWRDLDPLVVARNWEAGQRGLNRATAIDQINRAINHLAASAPRLIADAHYNLALGALPTDTANPATQWLWPDTPRVSRHQRTTLLSIPRSVDPDDPSSHSQCYAQRLDNSLALDAQTRTAEVEGLVPTPTEFTLDEMRWYRGNRANSDQKSGLAFIKGYRCKSWCVQDVPVESLSTDADQPVLPEAPAPGDPVLAGPLEAARAVLHEIRTQNLPIVLNWLALNVDGTFYAPGAASSGPRAIRVDSVTPVNALLQSVTSRTASSPGISAQVYRAGVGTPLSLSGKQIKCTVRYLAYADGANPGSIRCQGSDTFASNWVDVAVPTGASPVWIGSDSDFFYLDSDTTNTDLTSAANKCDILVTAGASSPVYLYAIRGWILYG